MLLGLHNHIKGKQYFNPADEVKIQRWKDQGNSHPLGLVLQQHKHAIISKGQHETWKYSYVPDNI